MTYVLIALPLIAIIASVFFAIRAVKKGKKAKTAFKSQVIAFAAVAVLTFAIPMVASATTAAEEAATPATTAAAAEGETTAADTQDKNFQNGMGLLAAGFVTAISGIGGGIAVAAAAPAAIGATSEDPKVFGKALIFVALGEGIALYGLLISILILNKVV